MIRFLATAALLTLTTLTVHAHFVFVVPDSKDPSKVCVVFSDDLTPDENVSIEKITNLKLTCRDSASKDTAVEHKTGKYELNATLPGTGARVVFGSVNYGVMQKGDSKPYLLAYHPKTVIGAVAADKLIVGEKVLPVEIVPVTTGSEVRFKFLAAGKPVADAEVNVIKPDGTKAKPKTDKDGLTEAFPAKGKYGVWAKDIVAKPGELGGKKYDEARHYATLVVEFPSK